MNKKLGMIGSILNVITVLLFAIFLLIDFRFGYFFVCILLSISFIMPMTGIFANSDGSTSMGGVLALEVWCLYFLPIGILSYKHFKNKKQ